MCATFAKVSWPVDDLFLPTPAFERPGVAVLPWLYVGLDFCQSSVFVKCVPSRELVFGPSYWLAANAVQSGHVPI